jgi:hypothetical protein
MPDSEPLRILRIEEMPGTNGLGEAIFIVAAQRRHPREPMTIMLAANPHTGEITRVAIDIGTGRGYKAGDPALVPGNLRDVIKTIVLDPREAEK